MVNVLETLFPGLSTSSYQVTSSATDDYNCIAWAASDVTEWWWPVGRSPGVRRFWPDSVPREETLLAFAAAFATLGYAPCDGIGLESGFEKIAIFADAPGIPQHAARQLSNGHWTSKLGVSEDIEHELHALEGDLYGTVALVMKRARVE